MRLFTISLLFCTILTLTACANHKNAYLKGGREVPGLVVPADVPVIKQEPYYPIPALPINHSNQKSVSLLPPTLQTA